MDVARHARAHEETYALFRTRRVLLAEGTLLGQLLRSRQLRSGGPEHAYAPMELSPAADGGEGATWGGQHSWGLEVEEEGRDRARVEGQRADPVQHVGALGAACGVRASDVGAVGGGGSGGGGGGGGGEHAEDGPQEQGDVAAVAELD